MAEPSAQGPGLRAFLLAPAAVVLVLLFISPLIYFLVVSFFRISLFNLVPAFSAVNYLKVAADYSDSIAFTIGIGILIALLTVILAFIIAHLIRFRGGRWGAFVLACTMLTLFGGYLVKIYAWKTILGREGIINNGLMALGVIGQPLDALLYSPLAVVLTLVNYLLPFAVLPIYGALRSIDITTIEAARDVGASPYRVLHDVILPRCIPALVTAFALCFLLTAGDYVTPRLVGGARSVMIGTFIESQFGIRMNLPLGAAMTFSILAAAALVIAMFWGGLRWRLRPR
jgi:spermidine/putrescine transport system permease protein